MGWEEFTVEEKVRKLVRVLVWDALVEALGGGEKHCAMDNVVFGEKETDETYREAVDSVRRGIIVSRDLVEDRRVITFTNEWNRFEVALMQRIVFVEEDKEKVKKFNELFSLHVLDLYIHLVALCQQGGVKTFHGKKMWGYKKEKDSWVYKEDIDANVKVIAEERFKENKDETVEVYKR